MSALQPLMKTEEIRRKLAAAYSPVARELQEAERIFGRNSGAVSRLCNIW